MAVMLLLRHFDRIEIIDTGSGMSQWIVEMDTFTMNVAGGRTSKRKTIVRVFHFSSLLSYSNRDLIIHRFTLLYSL